MKERTRYVILAILTALCLLLTGIVLVPGGSVADLSNSGILTGHLPIEINGDSDFTLANGVMSGSGTTADPYVIENWQINCNDTAHGIYIHGSVTKSFVIRNCYIFNGDGGSYYGIYVTQSGATDPDFVIENCNITDMMHGINVVGTGLSNPYQGDITVVNTTIYSSSNSGAIFDTCSGDISLDNCSFIDTAVTSLSWVRYDGLGEICNSTFSATSLTYYHLYFNARHAAPTTYYDGRLLVDNVTFGKVTTADTISSAVIEIDQCYYGAEISNVTINGHPKWGIQISQNTGTPMDGFNINDSYIADIGDRAIYAQGTTMPFGIRNVDILDSNWGIDVSWNNARITDCTVTDMTDTTNTHPVGIINWYLASNTASVLAGNTLSGVGSGIYVASDYVLVEDNVVTDTFKDSSNAGACIYAPNHHNSVVRNNILTNGTYGLEVSGSTDNEYYGNWISGSETGIHLADDVTGCLLWGNYIYGNEFNATDDDVTVPKDNLWNETYANGGGNYWGDYSGFDTMSGVLQDTFGADGFGDTPYTIKLGVDDNYPLMRLPDDIPPNSTLKPMPYWQTATPFNVTFQAYDNSWLRSGTLQYKFSIDNATFPPTYSVWGTESLSGVAAEGNLSFDPAEGDGFYWLMTNATDFENNEETDLPIAADLKVGVDTAPPSFVFTAFPETTNDTHFELNYTVDDATSGWYTIEWGVVNSTTTAFNMSNMTTLPTKTYPDDSNLTYDAPDRGLYYLFGAAVTDNAGNVVQYQLTGNNGTFVEELIIPNDPPVTTIGIGDPKDGTDPVWVTNATEFTLGATDDHGIDFSWYSIDGGASFLVYSAPFTIPDGTTEVQFGSLDIMGLNETVQSVNVSVDSTAPVTTLTIGTPKSGLDPVVVSEATEFNLTANDAGIGYDLIRYNIDNTTWTVFTENFTISGYGLHTLEYYSVDVLGNTEDVMSVNLSIPEPIPPLPKITGKVVYKGGDLAGENATDVEVKLVRYNQTDSMLDIATTLTDNLTGEFVFADVAAGINYSIIITPPDGLLYVLDAESGYRPKVIDRFDVAGTDLIKDATLDWYDYVPPLPVLSGQVTYKDGPLAGEVAAGAAVVVKDDGGVMVDSMVTGPDGNFSFELEAGTGLTLTVTPDDDQLGEVDAKTGYLPKEEAFDITGDLTKSIELEHYTYDPPVVGTVEITSPSEGAIYDPGDEIVITGTSTDLPQGTQLTVEISGEIYYASVGGDGTWTVTIIAPDDPGTHQIIVTSDGPGADVFIEVRDEETNYTTSMILVIALVVALLVALVLAILLWMKKKEDTEEKEYDDLEDVEDFAEDKEIECATCGSVFLAEGHDSCPECGEDIPEEEEE